MPDINIRVEAEDDSGDAFEEASRGIESLGESADTATGSFEEFAKSLSTSATELEHGMSMMTRLDLVQLTVDQRTQALTSAQEKYNEAVAKYGPSSQQAEQAARALTTAQDGLDKANMRAELSLGLVAAQSIQMATTAIPETIAAFEALTAAEGAAAVAASMLEVAMTAGVAAIGIVAGITAVSAAIGGMGDAASDATGKVDMLADAEGKLARASTFSGEAARKSVSDASAASEAAYQVALSQLGAFENKASEAHRRLAAIDQPGVANDVLLRYKKDAADADRDLAAAQQNLTRAENDMTLAHHAAAQQYIADDNLRVLETKGSLEEVNKAILEHQAFIDQTRAYLRNDDVSDSTRASDEQYIQEQEVIVRALTDRKDALTQAAEQTAASEKAAAAATAQAWESALGSVNLNLSTLSTSILHQAATTGGELGVLASQVLGVRDSEDQTLESVLRNSEALRNQATITRQKGETTEEFKKRLEAMGYSEADVESQVTDTTKSFSLQIQATKELATATTMATPDQTSTLYQNAYSMATRLVPGTPGSGTPTTGGVAASPGVSVDVFQGAASSLMAGGDNLTTASRRLTDAAEQGKRTSDRLDAAVRVLDRASRNLVDAGHALLSMAQQSPLRHADVYGRD